MEKEKNKDERTESYGRSLIVTKKIIEIDGRFVEVRLMEVDYGKGVKVIPRARWANRDKEAIRLAYERGYKDGKRKK